MTGGARHDIINFVMQPEAWNLLKFLRHSKTCQRVFEPDWLLADLAELLAAERLDALALFELHMTVLEDLSRQHATQVATWSRRSRSRTSSADGKTSSVYQHESTKAENKEEGLATSVAQWIAYGMQIERDSEQSLVVALVRNHRDHLLQDTLESFKLGIQW
ncbi:hypothetical protein GGX14DRAFT_393412 [Mycena pura]|uniref:Uncharacterized protein n=1 Tax=Mycena pura TaxID=153505 RepID=A0AAD6YIJ1_9AGAR|nr:hypothetical protein GGX14DRAFT_393412 [Mycena pura]